MDTIYLDTETTGLTPGYDEALEIAIVDDQGRVLLETFIRPIRTTEWHEAERIHGITPAMVSEAPTMEALTPTLLELVRGRHLVIYNAAYDMPFLPRAVREAPERVSCAMIAFAPHGRTWNEWANNWRWVKLTTAANIVDHVWRGNAHRALADAFACRAVWHWLKADPRRMQTCFEEADHDIGGEA